MKHFAALAVILLVAGGAIYFAQRRPRQDAVSAGAILNAAADWQRDVTRAPMHLTRISDREESRIGDQIAAHYLSGDEEKSPETKAAEAYVSQVGERVAAHARRKLDFRFHLVADRNLINAFALPGGHVFIGQGLIDQMSSEDELAFVLGHEIEHIDHYHSAERIQIEAQLRKLDLDDLAWLAGIPMSLWQAGYSKDEEAEADREGLRLAVSAGYSAQGALDLLERWTKLHREYVIHAEDPTDELGQLAIEGLNGYFRSHPLPSERLAQAREVIAHDNLVKLALNRQLTPLRIERAAGEAK